MAVMFSIWLGIPGYACNIYVIYNTVIVKHSCITLPSLMRDRSNPEKEIYIWKTGKKWLAANYGFHRLTVHFCFSKTSQTSGASPSKYR